MVEPCLLRKWNVHVDFTQVELLNKQLPSNQPWFQLHTLVSQAPFKLPLGKFPGLHSAWDLFLERCNRVKDWTGNKKPAKQTTAKKCVIFLFTSAQKVEK